MKRIVTGGMLFGMLWALLSPLPAFAANTDDGPTVASPSQSQASPAGGPPARHADIDNNGISDNLQAKIAGAAAGDKFDVVVTFKAKGQGNAASAQAAVGAFGLKREFSIISGFAATMTAAQVRALSQVPGVFRVEEDSQVRALLDDIRADLDLDRIQEPGPDQIVDGQVIPAPATGQGVKVCIIDTGLHAEHVMFAGRPIVWFDEVNFQPTPYDDHGHGTHVTGIALGSQGTHSGGTIPISGTAWEADIIAVKVLDATGFGPISTIVAGFDRCIESNADVISVSLGDFIGGDCQDAMALAARAASEPPHNIFVAAAAGNSGPGNQTIASPACEPLVTAVGASTNHSGDVFGDVSGTSLIAFSSRGPVQGPPNIGSWTKPDVVYPGVDVKSAWITAANNNYANLSGTSMATPGVAGLAAMALQVNPGLTPGQIQTLLRDTAYDFGPPGVDDDWGAGHVNPYLFMARVKDPAANPEPSPFQEHFSESVTVAAGGSTFSQTFEVTAADVAAGTPIALVVTIDGTPFCPFDSTNLACEIGIIGWDYDPDIDVQLHWDDGTLVPAASAGDITLSQCVLSGEACGIFKGRGRQETIRLTPVQPGFMKLRLYSFTDLGAGGGTARIERWHRLANSVAPPPDPNTAPVADPQSVTTDEDTATAITLTASDADAGDTLTYSVVSGPSNGALSGTAPNLTYTPTGDYSGTDSFTFKANDGTYDSNIATVTITVNPVNDAPVADSKFVGTTQDTAVAITLSGSDVDAGDTLSFALASLPSNGGLSGTMPNLTYTPNSGYTGGDSFNYTVSDGQLVSTPATVTISVNPDSGNTAPVANAQSVITNEDTATAVTLTATDVDSGDTLTYSVVSGPSNGLLTGTAPNLTYSPNGNYSGTDSFTFKANDGTDDSNIATVTITVNPVNDAPVADAKSVSTTQDTAVAVTLSGSDVEGSSLFFSVVSGPSNGFLSGTAPNLTYTPNSGYTGGDSFDYTVNDGELVSAPATVTITVAAVSGGVGTVSGKVRDSVTGANLKGVDVTTDWGQTATTNKQGKYRINDVPEGDRTLTFELVGYFDRVVNSITVTAGSTTRNVNTSLDPVDGGGGGGGGGVTTGTIKGSISLTTGGKVKLANVTASTGETDMSGNGGKYTLNLDDVSAGVGVTVTATKSANGISCSGEGTVTPVAGGTVTLNIAMSC